MHRTETRDEWLAAPRSRTCSTYARGVDPFFGVYHWLCRAPNGRNETGPWFRRHDEYDSE